MASTAVQTPSNPFSDSRDRRKTQAAPKKEIWSTLLNSVSSGKRLPEKQLLLLGGTPQSQKDFLESLSTDTSNNRRQQTRKPPPVANQYALGYTYQDVLDADQEETLARLSIYTLSTPSPAFGPLLKPLLTPSSLPNTLVVILLDWSQPWHWIRQLHSWISLLRSLIVSLDDESKHALDANLSHMRGRGHKRSNTADSNVSVEGEEELPLGPGEWDEPLGVPLAVVALNTDKMGVLERAGWNDAQFDFIGQFLRTILLKHGGSLIYTMPSSQGQGALQSLVHAGLGVRSGLVKRDSGTVYEVSRREGTLVPSNWDSWAKIRMMADQFDPEVVSKAWSTDIQASPSATAGSQEPKEDESHTTAIALYESTITNPKSASSSTTSSNNVSTALEVSSKDVQAFLGEQAKVLEEFQVSDRKERMAQESSKSNKGSSLAADGEAGRHVEEHIGPVQFNMGGIQVDAEEMVRKIRDREATRSSTTGGADDPSRVKSPSTPKTGAGGAGESAEMENQRLKDFFAGLAKKSGGSAANSPRRGLDG